MVSLGVKSCIGSSKRAGIRRDGETIASYGEPHLAVRYGIAVFEYVRILTISWLAKHALDS
jgi:hypothetical protein